MTHLVWFRNDLRTHDHAALHRACQTANKLGGSVLGIYVVDPVWFGETRFGFPRCGDFRQRFLRESLIDLAERMNRLGSHLIITHGDTGDCLANNIELLGGGKVFFHEEFGTEERELELRVKIILEARGIEWSSKPPSALYDLEQLPFPIDEIPELFTTFRKQVEKRAEVAEPLAAPESIPCAKALLNKAQSAGVPLESIACIGGNPDMSPKQSFTFRGGDTAGLGRLSQYLWETDAVATYFDTRNGMRRDLDSTKFSPWLANGCLSPRKVYAEVKQYERQRKKNKSTYWVFFELLWREYFRWIQQKHGASMFHVGGIRSADISWDDDADMFVAWRDGQTGFPIIDANMREIAATGWMSNRGRQNVASFLTKNLGQDWRIGAEWFESLLLDYDPTSNYGNWNYIAGVGNDAREFRWFNPIRQAENYDPKGDYVRHWCPELADVPVHSVHQPWRLDDLDYPEPIVDLHESADSNRRRFDL